MKKIIITFLVLILSVVIGGVTYVFTFDVNSYRGQIEKMLMDTTGYPVSIHGQMSLSKSLMPTLIVRDIQIKSTTGFSQPAILSAQKAELSFDLVSFFKNIINVQKIELSDVNVYFEINKVGQNNWVMAQRGINVAARASAQNAPARPTLSKSAGATATAQIDSIGVTRLEVTYINELDGVKKVFSSPHLSIKHLVNIDGEVFYQNERFTFSGAVKNLLTVIATKRNLNFSLDVQGLEGKTKIVGACRDVAQCEDDITLNLDVSGKNLKKMYAFFDTASFDIPAVAFSCQAAGRLLKNQLLLDGAFDLTDSGVNVTYNIEQDLSSGIGKGRINLDIIKPDLIQNYGLNPFSLQTNYSLTGSEKIEFSNITAMFDETDLDGNVTLSVQDKKPMITGQLHSHYFKSTNIFSDKKVSAIPLPVSEKNDETALFSKEKLPLEWMGKANAALSLAIDNFSANNLFARYPVILTTLQLKDSVLRVDLHDGSSVAGGVVVGRLSVDNQTPEQPIWTMQLIGEGLQFNQVNPWKKQLHAGDMNFNLLLDSKGDNLASILASMNGNVILLTNQVEVLSPIVSDLFSAGAGGTGLYKAPQDLFIKCGVLNAEVKNGVVMLDKRAAVETSRFNMLIDGDINLKDETINMHFIPQKTRVQAGQIQDIISAVNLKGPLDNPKPSIEADVTPLLSVVLPALVSDKSTGKKAVLDAYTKKPVEDISVCRVATSGMTFKTIDAYLGRNKIQAVAPTEQVAKPEATETKAEKIGREFLNSLSDVLVDKDTATVK